MVAWNLIRGQQADNHAVHVGHRLFGISLRRGLKLCDALITGINHCDEVY
jgi:hypothetical protein